MSSQAPYSELVTYTRRRSRLISTICGPPASRRSGAAGCGCWPTIQPSRIEPVSRGLNGSLTSYCFSSPVPHQDTYSHLLDDPFDLIVPDRHDLADRASISLEELADETRIGGTSDGAYGRIVVH